MFTNAMIKLNWTVKTTAKRVLPNKSINCRVFLLYMCIHLSCMYINGVYTCGCTSVHAVVWSIVLNDLYVLFFANESRNCSKRLFCMCSNGILQCVLVSQKKVVICHTPFNINKVKFLYCTKTLKIFQFSNGNSFDYSNTR